MFGGLSACGHIMYCLTAYPHQLCPERCGPALTAAALTAAALLPVYATHSAQRAPFAKAAAVIF